MKCKYLYLIVLVSLLMASCANKEFGSHVDWTLSDSQRDSVAFVKKHHYNIGFNFVLVADSMKLWLRPLVCANALGHYERHVLLEADDEFVVTEIFIPEECDSLGADSVWVRVGSYGKPQGWVTESEMLEKSAPVNLISRFINFFSRTHIYALIAVLCIFALGVAYKWKSDKRTSLASLCEVKSNYTLLYCFFISTAAMLYQTIQVFAPDIWVDYYFNPSLNPLGQPVIIGVLLSMVWLAIVMLLSVAYDLFEKVPFFSLLSYMVSLVLWGGLLYVIITFTVQIYIGYALYIAYIVYLVISIFKFDGIKGHLK